MEITEYAKTSKLPLKILRWMVEEKFIQNPMNERDLIAIDVLEKTWMRREYLRVQLSRFSKKRRYELLEKADLDTKWERYAYTRLMNLPPGNKLSMNKLINEIEITYGFTLKQYHKKKLVKVKTRVYNKRRKRKIFVKSGK